MTHIDLNKRTDFPAAFDERATLTQLLSYVRLTVHAKCAGLSQSDAVQTLCVPRISSAALTCKVAFSLVRPAVRLSPDHAGGLLAAAVSA